MPDVDKNFGGSWKIMTSPASQELRPKVWANGGSGLEQSMKPMIGKSIDQSMTIVID